MSGKNNVLEIMERGKSGIFINKFIPSTDIILNHFVKVILIENRNFCEQISILAQEYYAIRKKYLIKNVLGLSILVLIFLIIIFFHAAILFYGYKKSNDDKRLIIVLIIIAIIFLCVIINTSEMISNRLNKGTSSVHYTRLLDEPKEFSSADTKNQRCLQPVPLDKAILDAINSKNDKNAQNWDLVFADRIREMSFKAMELKSFTFHYNCLSFKSAVHDAEQNMHIQSLKLNKLL